MKDVYTDLNLQGNKIHNAINVVTSADENQKILAITKADYEALPTKDPDTYYMIIDDEDEGGGAVGSGDDTNPYIVPYSTEEHVISAWIDGKPIYRKAVRIENDQLLNDAGYKAVSTPTMPTDVDTIIQMWYISIVDKSFPRNTVYWKTLGTTSQIASTLGIHTKVGDYFIIEYTKTTD